MILVVGVFETLQAQSPEDSTKIFTLGEVVVTPKEKELQTSITAQQTKEFHRLLINYASHS